MAEKQKYPDRVYTPEYWDGHHKADVCPQGVSFEELMKGYAELVKEQVLMRDSLADQIERYKFLQQKDFVTIAMAKFDKGTTFVPDAYPHGTLIKVSKETLSFNEIEQGREGYSSSENFGFVTDTTGITEHGKSGILYVRDRIIYGGSYDEIRVGEVEHRRRTILLDLVNDVSRVTGVEVISIGSGRKMRSRFAGVGAALGRLLPVLSPQPSPQPAG